MLKKLAQVVRNEEKRDLGLTALGMGGLLVAGPFALIPFALGARGLEKQYRRKNGFSGSWKQRWRRAETFYESTHVDKTNRMLHLVGMPFIVAGSAGLMVSSPLNPLSWPVWAASAGSYTGGWALNLAGHKYFEKNAPAFEEDPLSFVAGPMWEVGLIKRQILGGSEA